MAQEKEKKNKKYRFETYAFITIVKCMMWSWTALVAFLTVMLLGEGKGIPDIRRMIELIGSWLLAVCGIGVLYCSKADMFSIYEHMAMYIFIQNLLSFFQLIQ